MDRIPAVMCGDGFLEIPGAKVVKEDIVYWGPPLARVWSTVSLRHLPSGIHGISDPSGM